MDERLNKIAKFNYWGNKVFDLGFLRSGYTNKIADFTGNRLIKVLVGQRRTGKSYILRQVAKNLIDNGLPPKNTLFINKEFTNFDFLIDYKALDEFIKLYKSELKPEGRIYIFIDEIQNIEGWERVVNSYSQDYTENFEFFVSGSNSKMISTELASLLSGRYVTFNIFPFSYTEFLGITKSELSKTSYLEYMSTGGLPELFAIPKPETRRNYVAAIKDTVMLRDIIQRQNIREPGLLEDIFVYLINNASNLISVSNVFNYFKSLGRKTSYDIISNYIGYLQDSFLVHRCERYDIRGKQTIAGNVKFYANDLAYKNYLYPGFGYGFGYMLENLLYLDLRRAGYEVYTGNIRNKEVDFIAKKADKTIYIQCAYLLAEPETIEREYAPLETIDDNYEKFVVTLDDLIMPSNKGIRHVQAWNLAEFI
ncbi:MAG TPA: ATP-binding protein [Draconibacterium sp.]|nr:ATP-binding protein [Draconibacterium sp.]